MVDKFILVYIDNVKHSKSICDAAIYFAKNLKARITILSIADNKNLFSEIKLKDKISLINKKDKHNTFLINDDKINFIEQAKNYCKENNVLTNILRLHGDFNDIISNIENKCKMIVLSKIDAENNKLNIKNILKITSTPIMLANKQFKPINNVLFAYDDNKKFNQALRKNLKDPLFGSSNRYLIHLNKDSNKAELIIKKAKELFNEFNVNIQTNYIQETGKDALLNYAYNTNMDLIAMGAYSNSTLSSLFKSPFVNEIIKYSQLPVFIFK